MEDMFSLNKEAGHETFSSSHDEEPPMFLHFPSPFEDIYTPPVHTNDHLRPPNKLLDVNDGAYGPSVPHNKRARKRSAGKTDRHSKIHTAQGLRDRRMRLSLHIARKFFDLQDLLGFDKASKTIDWLFCKSDEAIKEVTESFNQSMNEETERIGSPLSESKVYSPIENSMDEIRKRESRKDLQTNALAKQTRDRARERARERTRERMTIKDLEKSKQLFGSPADGFDKLGLGFAANPNSHTTEKLCYTSSAFDPIHQESPSPSLQHSSTHYLLHQLQLAHISENFDNYLGSTVGSSAYCSTFDNHNAADPPAGWLNTSNKFLGFFGEWSAENFRIESDN